VYVCLCRVVTRKTIEAAIADGARTVEEVGERCGAGTDCGKCHRNIQRLLTLQTQPTVTIRSTADRRQGV
jgi:bacterioferritin-associated ferredoxin